jgi:hypothetical protein
MCDPVTLAVVSTAVMAGTAYTAHEQGVKAAENQSDALSKAEDMRQADMARQMEQQNAAAADELNAAHRAALSDMSTLDTLAGEMGGGGTASRARSVAGIQQDETLATIGHNATNGLAEIGFTAKASHENALSQIRGIQAPSQVGTLLAIGSAGLNGYNNYQQGQKLDKLAAQGKQVK